MTDQKHRLLEDQLQGLKKDYMKHQMSETQLEQLRQKIKEAKTMDKTANNTRTKSRQKPDESHKICSHRSRSAHRALCHFAQHLRNDCTCDGTASADWAACEGGHVPKL